MDRREKNKRKGKELGRSFRKQLENRAKRVYKGDDGE